MERVMELLTKLSAQVAEEGKVEAEQYDKYSCFCKDNADKKLYNIEKSEKVIAEQTAKIDKLATEITSLSEDIDALTTRISNPDGTEESTPPWGLTEEIEAATLERKFEFGNYTATDDDMVAAIKAIEGAIKALKDSKGALEGDAKTLLLQVEKAVPLVHVNSKQASVFAQLHGPHSYEYQSNDIIATLEDLKDTFLQNKKELDEEEFEANSAFEKKTLNLANEKKFAEKERDEKNAQMEAKTEKKEALEGDRTEETNDMNADQAFLDELTTSCEQKAKDWDQRSQSRADELTALAKATEALKSGAVDQYSANQKLSALQKGAPPSFLQVRGTSSGALQMQATQKTFQLLTVAARKLKSPALSVLSMKVKLAADHFVKVRQLIKDLVQRLQDAATAEATQKQFCDTKMGEAMTSRDEANAAIETAISEITRLNSENKQLTADIAALQKAISDNQKAISEMTELRDAEKAENEARIQTASEGQTAVNLALSTLKEYYEKGAFVQYTPPNAGRDGLTVADKAPESFSGEYHGNGAAGKGIIGILDVIHSDFERTVEKTTGDEAANQGIFDDNVGDLNGDTETKQNSINTKEGQIETNDVELTNQKQDNKDAQKKLKGAEKDLSNLKKICVEGEETYEQRVAKREKEIAALKEAMTILDNWQG